MKDVFLKDRAACDWLAETVNNPKFSQAKVHAISQLASALPGNPGDEHKLRGAVLVLDILSKLWESPSPQKKASNALDYTR
jgi:hypothetical protein